MGPHVASAWTGRPECEMIVTTNSGSPSWPVRPAAVRLVVENTRSWEWEACPEGSRAGRGSGWGHSSRQVVRPNREPHFMLA